MDVNQTESWAFFILTLIEWTRALTWIDTDVLQSESGASGAHMDVIVSSYCHLDGTKTVEPVWRVHERPSRISVSLTWDRSGEVSNRDKLINQGKHKDSNCRSSRTHNHDEETLSFTSRSTKGAAAHWRLIPLLVTHEAVLPRPPCSVRPSILPRPPCPVRPAPYVLFHWF